MAKDPRAALAAWQGGLRAAFFIQPTRGSSASRSASPMTLSE